MTKNDARQLKSKTVLPEILKEYFRSEEITNWFVTCEHNTLHRIVKLLHYRNFYFWFWFD